MPETLTDYLSVDYPLNLIPDPDGGYVFEYPDLPGCLGQIDSLDELSEHAEEAHRLWLETALDRGKAIPLPARQEEFSGKFIVRISRSLHRRLVETAKVEGISLNYYAGTLLASGQVERELSGRIEELCSKIDALHDHLSVSYDGLHRRLPDEMREFADEIPLAA